MHRPPTSLWRLLAPIALVVAVLGAPAQARDSWTHLRPGVDWLRRSVPGVVPQQVRAARFDLSRPEVSVHASVDLTHSERTVATSTFGRHIGAIAAINGDVSDGEVPVGLAIGDGAQWHDPPASHAWSYFACDIFNQCTIDTLPPHDGSWAFLPALYPYRYYNAVGGEAELLLRDGVRGPECDCPTCRDARSAVGLDETGTILWFVVVEAGHAGASGMTCGELRDLLEELGVHDAMMLAGGPNSALWVDGILRNYPTEGREAVQANHLAVMYTPTADPQCTVRSRRWCEESIVRTCTGGRLVGERVCADSEAGCGSDGDWAFCVDPRQTTDWAPAASTTTTRFRVPTACTRSATAPGPDSSVAPTTRGPPAWTFGAPGVPTPASASIRASSPGVSTARTNGRPVQTALPAKRARPTRRAWGRNPSRRPMLGRALTWNPGPTQAPRPTQAPIRATARQGTP